MPGLDNLHGTSDETFSAHKNQTPLGGGASRSPSWAASGSGRRWGRGCSRTDLHVAGRLEGAFLVPEELALEQRGGHGAAMEQRSLLDATALPLAGPATPITRKRRTARWVARARR